MLTPDQVNALHQALLRKDLPANPALRLVVAAGLAELRLSDVLDHLVIQALLNARDDRHELSRDEGQDIPLKLEQNHE